MEKNSSVSLKKLISELLIHDVIFKIPYPG